MKLYLTLIVAGCCLLTNLAAQKKQNDSNTPLHLLTPDYPVPYGIPDKNVVKKTLDRIKSYLDKNTPYEMNDANGKKIFDFNDINSTSVLKKGDFRIISYEWGVTYSAMLKIAELTGDLTYKNYTENRLNFIAEVLPYFSKQMGQGLDWADKGPFRNLLNPHALDDCGAMCTAMIKSKLGGSKAKLDYLIDNHINYILHKEFKLSDGTLARNRPQPNTLWLDDLFMGVPALAWKGRLSGDLSYYEAAVHQIELFHKKMYNNDKKIFMHGWVEDMEYHPQFHWARANGWALLTLTEVLDALPVDYPGRAVVLSIYKDHVMGLQKYQSGKGFWHQLLDKTDSYLETSATAIYTYCIAHGINQGWLDKVAFAPTALLGWNAVSTKINNFGQVEGTCVGTGMAFDPAFYYHRPVSAYAAHGYGPTLLAGAEIFALLSNDKFEINDSSVQVLKK
jgi:unsaturated rhamnogalacturonyl hydrolase